MFKKSLVSILISLLYFSIFADTDKLQDKETTYKLNDNVSVKISKPVFTYVAPAAPEGVDYWGYYQFAILSDYPEGGILLQFNNSPDAVKAYGTPTIKYLSKDMGKTWEPFNPKELPPSPQHIAKVFNDEFIFIPKSKPYNLTKNNLKLTNPVSSFISYHKINVYKLEDQPKALQEYVTNISAYRWTPKTKKWEGTEIHYPLHNALSRSVAATKDQLVPHTFFEHSPIEVGNELIYADYRQGYIDKDGVIPKKPPVSCMVSTDNGKTFQYRSTIAFDAEGNDSLSEPMLSLNSKGELICVIRRADQDQKSMLITTSNDKGKIWSKPVPMDNFGTMGVMPSISLLKCGTLALSYGRPGVWLSFSLDGIGKKWTKPICIIKGKEGTHVERQEDTDGYTSILSISDNSFLLAYTDFKYKDSNGNIRKAIIVREVTLVIK